MRPAELWKQYKFKKDKISGSLKDADLHNHLREYFEERAAIMEFEGGLSKELAEKLAMDAIKQDQSFLRQD